MKDATDVVMRVIMPRIVSKNGTVNAKIVSVMIMMKEVVLRYVINVVIMVMFQEIAHKVKIKNVNSVTKEVIRRNFVGLLSVSQKI